MVFIIKILALAFLIIFFLSSLFVYMNTHLPRYPLHIPPSEYSLEYEEVSFRSKDALLLKGWFIKPETGDDSLKKRWPAIIICHGLGANKSDFTGFSKELAQRGYSVLLFDFRGHGESEGKRTSIGYLEQRDLLAAIDYVKGREDVLSDKVGIYGFSLGAAVAILTAARYKNVQAVVSDSSFTSLREQGGLVLKSFYHLPSFPFEPLMMWIYDIYFLTDVSRVSPLREIDHLPPIPVFIIGGGRDQMMPPSFAERLFEAAKEPKSLWIIKEAGHGETLSLAGEDYTRRVAGFFDQYLKAWQ